VSEPRVGIGATLDEAAFVVTRIAAPWVGLLWLGGIPLRLLQAQLAGRVLELGKQTSDYGDALRPLALGIMCALVLELVCRTFFCKAAWLGLRLETAPGREALRVPAMVVLSSVAVALLFETLFFALGATLLALPFCALGAGLAAAHAPHLERAGFVPLLREVAGDLRHSGALLALSAVLTAAFAAAAVNLYFVFQIGLWLAGGIPGLDLLAWADLLSVLKNSRFVLVLLAGSWLAVEPYYLALLTVFVHRLRSRQSGEDLRLWFARLSRSRAA
jgi:hypothetical protein